MSKSKELLDESDEPFPPILAPTLKVINQLEAEGIIESPAIGGSIALVFHAQPMKTDDLDIFCFLSQSTLIISLSPIYKRLEELGYSYSDGACIDIEGVNVQFLIPDDPLTQEALRSSIVIDCEGVPTRVFQYEYALAVKAQANRTKDWGHIGTALESKEPDIVMLEGILKKYDLLDRWKRKTNDD